MVSRHAWELLDLPGRKASHIRLCGLWFVGPSCVPRTLVPNQLETPHVEKAAMELRRNWQLSEDDQADVKRCGVGKVGGGWV